MDLADLKINLDIQNRGKLFYMLDAEGKTTEFGLRILGPDSNAMKRSKQRVRDRQYKRARISAEEIDEATIDVLCSIIVGWEGLTKGGNNVPFTSENLRELLTEYPVIREQAEVYAHDRRFFTEVAENASEAKVAPHG